MNFKVRALAAISLPVMLSGCVSMVEKAVESGGEIVEINMLELIGSDGSTSVSKDGKWVSYYSADGRKALKLNHKGGEVVELKWRENEKGEFCEEVYSAGKKEFCGDEAGITTVKNSDGSYSDFRSGKSFGVYTIENGNSQGL